MSRRLKAGLKIRPETGEIYKPVSRCVRIPSAIAAGEQTAQAERKLADAAQTVDDQEEKLDELQDR